MGGFSGTELDVRQGRVLPPRTGSAVPPPANPGQQPTGQLNQGGTITSMRQLCDEVDSLAQRSGDKSYEEIRDEFNRIVAEAQTNPKVAASIQRIGEQRIREHLRGIFDSSFQAAHGHEPPDGKTFLQRAGDWFGGAWEFTKDVFKKGAEIVAKIDKWIDEGLESVCKQVWDWVSKPENWKKLGESIVKFVGDCGTTVKDFLANGAVKFYEAMKNGVVEAWTQIKETLTDPRKLCDFLKRAVTGELALDLMKATWDGVCKVAAAGWEGLKAVGSFAWGLVTTLSQSIGLTDLLCAVGCCFTGDWSGAWDHLKKAGTELCETTGLANFYRMSELMIQAIDEDNPQLFYKALTEGVIGTFKIVVTVATVGEGAALVQGAKALATSLIYRGVAKEAIEIAGKEFGATVFNRMSSAVCREEFEKAGLKAGTNLGQKLESKIAQYVDEAVGRKGAYEATERFTDAEAAKINEYLASKTDDIAKYIEQEGEVEGHKVTKELIDSYCKRMGKSRQQLLEEAERDMRKAVRRSSKEDVENLVRTHFPQMSEAEITRTAQAFRHIAEGNWRFSKAQLAAFKKAAGDELTDRMLKNGLEEGFAEGWNAQKARIKKKLADKNLEISEEAWAKFDDAAIKGFRKGVRRAVHEWIEEYKAPKKVKIKLPAGKPVGTKPIRQAEFDAGEGLDIDMPHGSERDSTIAANQFQSLNTSNFRGRTYEQVMKDIDDERVRQAAHRRGSGGDEHQGQRGPTPPPQRSGTAPEPVGARN